MRIIAIARSLRSGLSAAPAARAAEARRRSGARRRRDQVGVPDRAGRLAVAARCRTRRCRQCSAHTTIRRRRGGRGDPEAREGHHRVSGRRQVRSATGRRASALAQSGYGLRFTDYPAARRPNGGNCYACHQMTKAGGELRHDRAEPAATTARSASSARPRPRRPTRRSTIRRRPSRARRCRGSAPTRC